MSSRNPHIERLADMEKQHSDALTRAESHPTGSQERCAAYRDADTIAARIRALLPTLGE